MYIIGEGSMRKSFKDSLKVLEADIQHANTLASDFPKEYGSACLQMRMSYSPAANLFLFLVQWTDCNLAGALGLLRILIYKVYIDGTTTMSINERKASIREFYAIIYPSLLQLERGVTDREDKRQKEVCMDRYRRKDNEECEPYLDLDIEREEECGICMEMNCKIVLPNCNHAMCSKCYKDCSSAVIYWCFTIKEHISLRSLQGEYCFLVSTNSVTSFTDPYLHILEWDKEEKEREKKNTVRE